MGPDQGVVGCRRSAAASTEGLAVEMAATPEEMEALLRRFERFGNWLGSRATGFSYPETIVALGVAAHALAVGSEEAGFTAAEFNKHTGIGRNLTIIVLEYLDWIGVTRRAGDLRHVVRSVEVAMG